MMYTLQEYGDLFERLGLTELSVEEGEFKLKIKKQSQAVVSAPASQIITNAEVPKMHDQTENPVKADEKTREQSISGLEVKAPLVGIFYAAGGEKPALKVGDHVKKGDTLCVIEVMKMLNEVKSPADGSIAAVCAEDGSLVEFDQVLFVLSEDPA